MPFVLVRGTYHVVGFQPDGNSVRFQPADPADWDRLPGRRRPRLNSRAQAQLRLEGIDAPETHFSAGGVVGVIRQPARLADAARDRLLALLGIAGVVLAPDGSTIAAAADGTAGFILCREVEQNGRPVAFAYAGEPPPGLDADDVFLDEALLAPSVNQRLLEEGLAYPTYYTTLFQELRAAMTTAVTAARQAGLGVWPEDRTRGCTITGIATLSEDHVVLPKLFRRLATFIAGNGGDPHLGGFRRWLAAEDERVLVIPGARTTGFDDLVEVDQATNTVGLLHDPAELAFVPRQLVPKV